MIGRRFQPGQPVDLRAEELNSWQRAAEQLGSSLPPPSGRPAAIQIPVRNTHTAAIGAFSVAALADALHDPAVDFDQFVGNPAIDCEPFTSSNVGATPVVVSSFIDAGEVGLASIQGVQVARVNVSDTDHAFATPSDSTEWELESSASGRIPVLWKEAGTGMKWAYVLLGGGAGISGPGRVVVLSASVASGPTPFDSLTYEVVNIDTGVVIPVVSANTNDAIHRRTPLARYGEGFNVDPARPGTPGRAELFPVYSNGSPTGEVRTRVILDDERPWINPC